jgi:hypothetical protein
MSLVLRVCEFKGEADLLFGEFDEIIVDELVVVIILRQHCSANLLLKSKFIAEIRIRIRF